MNWAGYIMLTMLLPLLILTAKGWYQDLLYRSTCCLILFMMPLLKIYKELKTLMPNLAKNPSFIKQVLPLELLNIQMKLHCNFAIKAVCKVDTPGAMSLKTMLSIQLWILCDIALTIQNYLTI